MRAICESCGYDASIAFAEAQRSCLHDLDMPIPGGRAGHRWLPVAAAGAYAPGGRHSLPSSVLMTAGSLAGDGGGIDIAH
jgi:histidinol dehydrogenase